MFSLQRGKPSSDVVRGHVSRVNRRETRTKRRVGKARGGSPKTDRFIPRVYVSIRARQPFEESGSCSSKSSLDRSSSSCSTNSDRVFPSSWPAKRRPRSSSSSRPDASPDSGNRIRCYTSSTISEGLQNPSTPLRERESLVPPRWTVRRIPLGSQSCENPERRKRPGRGFLRREGRERERISSAR